jgi:peptide chain release factor 1
MFARCTRRPLFAIPSSLKSKSTIAGVSTSKSPFISPVLLKRARSIAAEHTQLSHQNAEKYEVETAKKIGELSTVASALAEWENAQNVIAFVFLV